MRAAARECTQAGAPRARAGAGAACAALVLFVSTGRRESHLMRRVTDLTEETPNKKAKTPGKAKATPKAETKSSTATQDDEVVNLGGVSILCAARCRLGFAKRTCCRFPPTCPFSGCHSAAPPSMLCSHSCGCGLAVRAAADDDEEELLLKLMSELSLIHI